MRVRETEAGKALADRLVGGDETAWRIFLSETTPIINSISRQFNLDEDGCADIRQAFLEKLLDGNCRVLRKFDAGKGTLFAWAKVIILRIVIDRFRNEKRRFEREKGISRDNAAYRSEGDSADIIVLRISMETAAVELLPEEQTLFFFVIRDIPEDEICRILGLKLNAVQQRISRLKKKLKPLFEKYGITCEN